MPIQTVRISEIISSLKNDNYNVRRLGSYSGIKQGGPFNEPLGNPGATSVTFRHDSKKKIARAIRVPYGIIPDQTTIQRLEKISKLLGKRETNRKNFCLVPFEVVRSAVYLQDFEIPVIIMPWIEGHTLHELARDFARTNNQKGLNLLVKGIEKLGKQFQVSAFDHGDISGGNIMIGEKGLLHIIDPDTLLHDSITNPPLTELGHISYAHPNRNPAQWESDLYRFPLEVIVVSLMALSVKPSLVNIFGDDDNSILFVQDDLIKSQESKLFNYLCNHNDDRLRERAIRLKSATMAKNLNDANKTIGPIYTGKILPKNNIQINLKLDCKPRNLSNFISPNLQTSFRRKNYKMKPTKIPAAMNGGNNNE
jgi:hypothetical protein